MARLDRESRVYTSGIAHHLYCAGRLADPGRTARALIAAGDAAHVVFATEEAVRTLSPRARGVAGHERPRKRAAFGTGNARGSAGTAGRSRCGDGALRQRQQRVPHCTGGGRSGAHRPQDRHAPLAGRRSDRSDGGVSPRAGIALRFSRAHRSSTPLSGAGTRRLPQRRQPTRRSSGRSARCNRPSARSPSHRPGRGPRFAKRRPPQLHRPPTRSAWRWRDRVSSTPPASASSAVSAPRRTSSCSTSHAAPTPISACSTAPSSRNVRSTCR